MQTKTPLYRQICGAVNSTIVAHGPITRHYASSATKRIIGALKNYEISFPDEPLKEALFELMAKEHRKLELLRKKLLLPYAKKENKAHIAGKIAEKRSLLLTLNRILVDFSPDAKAIAEKQGD